MYFCHLRSLSVHVPISEPMYQTPPQTTSAWPSDWLNWTTTPGVPPWSFWRGRLECDPEKREWRFVVVGTPQQEALDYALATIPNQHNCLVDAYGSYRRFINQVINPMRTSLKGSGIRCFKDLRAQRMIDVYEERCGQPAPLKQAGNFKRNRDLQGRWEVSREAGHGRIAVAASYIGKRARKDQEASRRESE